MKTVRQYLDDAINAGLAKNYAEIADRLNVTRACVSDWKNGKSAPNDEQAIALARLMKKPEIEILAEAAAYRAKTEEARKYWEQIAKYSAAYASETASTSSPQSVTVPPEAQAQPQNDVNQVFIMSTWRKIKATLRKMGTKTLQTLQPQWISQPAAI